MGLVYAACDGMTGRGVALKIKIMMADQARGTTIDGRADIFAAGPVFHFLLSGRKPFAAADLPSVLHKVQFEDPPPPSETEASPALARILFRVLAKDPAARHQRVRDMLIHIVRFRAACDAETRRLAPGVTAPAVTASVAGASAGDDSDTVRLRSQAARDPDDTAELLLDATTRRAQPASRWSRRVWGRIRSDAGQTTTEWLMIAGVLTGVAVFLLNIVPDTLGRFVRAIAWSIRTVAP